MRVSHQRVVRGETLRLRLTVRDQDGQPVDLTGATLYATVRAVVGGHSLSYLPPVIELSTASGIAVSTQAGDTLGQAVVTFSSTQTGARAPGNYAWDAWVVLPSGDRHAVVAPSRFTVLERGTAIP